jgi:hypothetical protein
VVIAIKINNEEDKSSVVVIAIKINNEEDLDEERK